MIAWYWYAILTALVSAIVFILQKKLLKTDHAAEFSSQINVLVLLLSLLFLPFVKLTNLNLTNIAWMYAISLFSAFGFLLISKSIKHSKLSNIAPLMNLGPLFVAIVAFIFLREKLNIMQIVGLFFLLLGMYVLQADHKMKKIYQPITKVFASKYNLFLFLGLIFYAFSRTMERYVLTVRINPFEAIILLHLFISINLLIYEKINGKSFKSIFSGLIKNKMSFLVIAILILIHRTMAYFAIKLTMAVALVSAIKRSGSFIATLLGGKLFNEDHLWQKSVACIVLIIGAVIIIIS